MAFMRAEIEGPMKWCFVDEDVAREKGVRGVESYWIPEVHLETEHAPYVSTTMYGYGGRLSAPGYLDCTEWLVCETKAGVAEEMLNAYFDQPSDEMDDEEKADVVFLANLLEDEDERTFWIGDLKEEE